MFEEVRQQKNNYWIESDLLYCMGKVGVQKSVKFVILSCRNKEFSEFAHENSVDGYAAEKRTKDRIVMSF